MRKPKLSDEIQKEICQKWLAGSMQSALAREFGVSGPTIKRVITAAGLAGQGGQPRNTTQAARACENARESQPPIAGAISQPTEPQLPPAGTQWEPRRPKLERPEYRAEFAALGPMKADPVDRVDWLHRALSISAQHIVADEAYPGDEVARRKELRDTARALAHCTPASLIARVLELIKADADERDEGGGGFEPEPDDGEPARRTILAALPRRGRPRKL